MYMKAIKFLMMITFLRESLSVELENNVCKTYNDYATKMINPNCRYNPDVDSRTPYMILRYGYPLEVHQVVTDDGYILKMYRIPHNNKDVTKKRQPIFIQHGANTDSAVWVDIGNRSLAFNLVELGFDVWLGNIRGSSYSQGHVLYNKNNPKFWDFSFHDMAIHDIPRQLDEVSEKTGLRGKIIYIGHSMGTTMSYIYSIRRKEHAEKTLVGIFSLAPVAYLHNMINLKSFVLPNYHLLSMVFTRMRRLGITAITPDEEQTFDIFDRYCLHDPLRIRMCVFLMMIGFGFDTKELMPEDFPLLLSYVASGMSTKTLQHFAQNAKGPFREFDYGPIKNKQVYGQITAPVYNLSSIGLPVHLYYGKNDGLAGQQDVEHLYAELRTKKSINPILPDDSVKFNHMDFMYAKDIKEDLYKPLFARIMSDFKVTVQ